MVINICKENSLASALFSHCYSAFSPIKYIYREWNINEIDIFSCECANDNKKLFFIFSSSLLPSEKRNKNSKTSSSEARLVILKKATSNLGISLLGGNAVGIFVHALQDDSPAQGPNGLRPGDQILEVFQAVSFV